MSAFVGRVVELATLDDIVRTALGGDVAAAVIVGEPGSGKSRLLAEGASRSHVSNCFRVVGYEPERQVPLSAASDLLRTLEDVTPIRVRLTDLVFAPAREDRSSLEPVRVFEAAHRALRTGGLALLLLDDLQWIDSLSLALCHYLVRAAEASGAPLALIAASRPSADATSFAASLGQVLPPERLTPLELGPLSGDEAFELVRALAPAVDDAAARELSERSGGSPFWLEALVRTAGDEIDPGHLVNARLRGAGADAGALLALLAVAGRPLTLADAGALNGWDPQRAEHAARELVTRGIAVDSGGVLRLGHDLIRDAAVRGIPEETRRDVHRRLAGWMERLAGTDLQRLREALHHRHEAALPALGLAERLARSPQRTLLGEEGLALLVGIVDHEDPADGTVLALNAEIGVLASALGRHDVALRRRLLVAERSPSGSVSARALLDAARSATALGDVAAARIHLTRARETRVSDELLELELDVQETMLDLWGPGRRDLARERAYELAARGRRLIAETGSLDASDPARRHAYLEVLRLEHDAARQDDHVERVARTAEAWAAAARGFDEEASLAATLSNSRAMRRMGRVREAEQRARYAWEEARRRVLPRLTVDAGYWLGSFLLQQGRISEAEEVVAEAAELVARVGDEAHGRHPIARLAHELAFHRGDWHRAVHSLLADADAGSPHERISLYQDAALWLALAAGEEAAEEVAAHVARARAYADEAACPRCATELRLVGAEALARSGRSGEAVQWAEEWETLQREPRARDRFIHGRVRALLRPPHGERQAVAELEAAILEAEKLGLFLDALWTRLDLGAALAASDRARAKDVLTSVAETATELGCTTARQMAEKRLRALGVRTWRRGAGAGPLTDRERAIAQLIVAGASNAEIAQQLFVSRKTVERHVSNMLRKVGVRNRAELAARVAELEVEGVHR